MDGASRQCSSMLMKILLPFSTPFVSERKRESTKHDFEFQSRLHECETNIAGGTLSFCRWSVHICVPAFFVTQNAGYNWMTGWMGYDFSGKYRQDKSVPRETKCRLRWGQELHSGRTAKTATGETAEMSHTVTSRETVLTVSNQNRHIPPISL